MSKIRDYIENTRELETSGVVSDSDIGVSVEAYDATILKEADIGSSVLAPNGDGSSLTGIQSPLVAGTDYLAPTGDGSQLTGIPSTLVAGVDYLVPPLGGDGTKYLADDGSYKGVSSVSKQATLQNPVLYGSNNTGSPADAGWDVTVSGGTLVIGTDHITTSSGSAFTITLKKSVMIKAGTYNVKTTALTNQTGGYIYIGTTEGGSDVASKTGIAFASDVEEVLPFTISEETLIYFTLYYGSFMGQPKVYSLDIPDINGIKYIEFGQGDGTNFLSDDGTYKMPINPFFKESAADIHPIYKTQKVILSAAIPNLADVNVGDFWYQYNTNSFKIALPPAFSNDITQKEWRNI